MAAFTGYAKPEKSFITRLLGPPPRRRHLDESRGEYLLHSVAHYYRQRRRALCGLFFGVLALAVAQIVYGLKTGTAGIVLGEPPPDPYARETMAARASFNESDYFVVYSLPCDTSSTPTLARTLSLMNPLDSPRAYTANLENLHYRPTSSEVADARQLELAAMHLFASNNEDKLPCLCAPLVGVMLRACAVRTSSGPRLLVNPTIIDKGVERAVVRHTQSAHFNISSERWSFVDGTSDVHVVRAREMNVGSFATAPAPAAHDVFTDALAYCIDECVDMLDGVTVWHRALEQRRLGVTVNGARGAALEALLGCE